MPERPALIVVSISARALAWSARRAGYAPLAIDVFGDCDTLSASADAICLTGGFANGFEEGALMHALEAMLAKHDPVGAVYGGGFDDRPELIAAIGGRLRVFGNDAATMARVKDPGELSRLCARLGVLHPETSLEPPAVRSGWLTKRRGACGGAHIRDAALADFAADDYYFQRPVSGESCSALFAANGWDIEIIGLTTQWVAPIGLQMFRYGGAVGPIDLPQAQAAKIRHAVAALSKEFGLVGINSADFIVGDGAVWLIEINARPGATLDVFDSSHNPLVAHHMAACDGRPRRFAAQGSIVAAATVYAPRDMTIRNHFEWPDWGADRSPSGTSIACGEPLCTVRATGATADAARLCVGERAHSIVGLIGNAAA